MKKNIKSLGKLVFWKVIKQPFHTLKIVTECAIYSPAGLTMQPDHLSFMVLYEPV